MAVILSLCLSLIRSQSQISFMTQKPTNKKQNNGKSLSEWERENLSYMNKWKQSRTSTGAEFAATQFKFYDFHMSCVFGLGRFTRPDSTQLFFTCTFHLRVLLFMNRVQKSLCSFSWEFLTFTVAFFLSYYSEVWNFGRIEKKQMVNNIIVTVNFIFIIK